MTDNGRDQVPNDLHPETSSRSELLAAAEAVGAKVPARANRQVIFDAIVEASKPLESKNKTQLIAQARDMGIDIPSRASKGDIIGLIEAKQSADQAPSQDTDGPESTDEAPAATVANHLPEDFDEAGDINAEPQFLDDGQTPGSTVFNDEPGLGGSRFGMLNRIKASASQRSSDFGNLVANVKDKVKGVTNGIKSKVDFRDWKTWAVIGAVLAVIAAMIIFLVVSAGDDSGRSDDDIVTPAVTVDDAFTGLCEADGNVDLTAMPTAGFQLSAGEASNDGAATVQSRVVDSYFADTNLGCSPQGIEFLRAGVDQERIDANRAGLDTRDSAGRIAYNGEHPDEAAVLAEYLQGVMSDCAAEMVVLSEADIQGGLYVLTFTDASYSDLIWVKLPAETALSGVDSIEVMRCTIGLVEGSDGLTRYFMYSEAFATFVSVETPFGNFMEYVPAAAEEAPEAAPMTVDDEPEAPEVEVQEQEQAAEEVAPEVDEPQDMPDTEVEQAEEAEQTTAPEQPKADDAKDKPKTGDETKEKPKKADTKDESKAKAETPADDAKDTTDAKPDTPAEDEAATDGQPETPADDGAQAPAVPVDAGDQGIIPGGGGCTGACGGPNEDGTSGGQTGDGPGNGGPGGCVGVCVGQGGDTGDGDGPGGTTPGGCNVDCNGGDAEQETEDEPEDVPEEEPEEECVAPNTLDAFGNCKAPPPDGAVDL